MGVLLLRTIKKACVFTGMAVGAGFASGREITDYFLEYGGVWVSGLLFAGVLFFLAVCGTSLIVRREGTADYGGYLSCIMGRRAAAFTLWVSGLFFFVMFFAMISASATAASELFGIPESTGVAVFVLICAVVILNGIDAVEKISLFLVPALVLGITLMAPENWSMAETLEPKGGSVYISAVIYVSYNVIAAPALVIGEGRPASAREDILTGLMCCAALTVMGIAAGGGILSADGASAAEFPLAAVAESRGDMFKYCYTAVFAIALLTTAVCNGMAAADFAAERFGIERKTAAVFMLGASVPLSGISFSAFVSKIYPLFGLAGILQLVGTIVYLAGHLTKGRRRKENN